MKMIRFLDPAGKTAYAVAQPDGTHREISGDIFGDVHATDTPAQVQKLLAPIESEVHPRHRTELPPARGGNRSSTTLLPGTVILTGTPYGVGMASKPPRWLKPGDTVVIEIQKIGSLSNPVIAESIATR